MLRLKPGSRAYRPEHIALARPPQDDDDPVITAEQAAQAEAETWALKYTAALAPLSAEARRLALQSLLDLLAASPEMDQASFVARGLETLANGYAKGWGPTAQQARRKDAATAEFRSGKLGRHARRHPEEGTSPEEYSRSARELLANPQRVLVRMDQNGKYEIGLMSGDEKDWKFGIIDPDFRIGNDGPPRMATLYGPKPNRPIPWSKRAGQLARNDGWVEVTG